LDEVYLLFSLGLMTNGGWCHPTQ